MKRWLFTLTLALANAAPLLAHDEVTPKPKLLQNGVPIERLSGGAGQGQVFKIIVPPDVSTVTFSSSGGKGDADLYVRHNAHPTTDSRGDDGSSLGPTADEHVMISNPEPGPWYVLVQPYTSFHGVLLKAAYDLAPGAVAIPTMLPAPGVFGGEATVQLDCAMAGAAIHYTIDESAPTESSPLFTGALAFTTTTHLRTIAVGANHVSSAETDGYYIIQPPNSVTELTTGVPLFHRAGQAGSVQFFKITIPPGEKDLHIVTEGGPGETKLFVRRGALPDLKHFYAKSDGVNNRAAINIRAPESGDWFILLRGYSDYSGVSVLATRHSRKADLIAWEPALQPYVSTETFDAAQCEVQEGMIDAGTHTLLRFSTETRNIGGASMVLPKPSTHPSLFEYAECHGHYHFLGFASYRLLDKNGQAVATGRKVSFCLEDIYQWDAGATPRSRFTCDHQGIQSGWADVYDSGLPGQWIDITGVPDGTYTLEVTMNPNHSLKEADYTNNTATVEVVLDSGPP